VVAAAAVLALTGGAFAAARYLAPDPEPVMVERPPPDPDAVVKEYARELAAGRPVTLIGATGKPRWHRWPVGEAIVGEWTTYGRVCQVTTKQLSLLELLPDPGCDRYRLSAEFYIQEPNDGKMRTAFFIGYEQPRAANGTEVNRFHQVGAEVTQNELTHTRSNKKAWVSDCYVLTDLHKEAAHPVAPALKLRPEQRELWRKVVAEVAPDRLRAFVCEDGADLKPFADLSASKLNAARGPVQQYLDKDFPGSGIRLRDWNPRAPLGVIIRNAGVAIRNVVVEPLGPKNP
jgi:serine/threonine-protein kinase